MRPRENSPPVENGETSRSDPSPLSKREGDTSSTSEENNSRVILGEIRVSKRLRLIHRFPNLENVVKEQVESAIQSIVPCVIDQSIQFTEKAIDLFIDRNFIGEDIKPLTPTEESGLINDLIELLGPVTAHDFIFESLCSKLKSTFEENCSKQKLVKYIDLACAVVSNENVSIACDYIQKIIKSKILKKIRDRMNEIVVEKGWKLDTQACEKCSQNVFEHVITVVNGSFVMSLRGNVHILSATSDNSIEFSTEELNPPCRKASTMDSLDFVFHKVLIDLEQLKASHPSENAQLFSTLDDLMNDVIQTRITQSTFDLLYLIRKSVQAVVNSFDHYPRDPAAISLTDAQLVLLNGLRPLGLNSLRSNIAMGLVETFTAKNYRVEILHLLIDAGLLDLDQFNTLLGKATLNGNHPLSIKKAIAIPQLKIKMQFYKLDEINKMNVFDMILRTWNSLNLTENPAIMHSNIPAFLSLLSDYYILKTEHSFVDFARCGIQRCLTQASYALRMNESDVTWRILIDSFMKMMALTIDQFRPEEASESRENHEMNDVDVHVKNTVHILDKFMGIVAAHLLQVNEAGEEFQGAPFHRIFVKILSEMFMKYDILQNTNNVDQSIIMGGLSYILHVLGPHTVPRFANAWIEIIGCAYYMNKMVGTTSLKCWDMFCQVVVDMFKFNEVYLACPKLRKCTGDVFYQKSLLLVFLLIRDFPDFLSHYYFHFLNVIPQACVQMRNIVVSASPKHTIFPNPICPDLQFHTSNPHVAPKFLNNSASLLVSYMLKDQIDLYLEKMAPKSLLQVLMSNIQARSTYDIPLLNAIVLYVGLSHIRAIEKDDGTLDILRIGRCSHMHIFGYLVMELNVDARYLFLNALANHLRFPSIHTHYFGTLLLYLFVTCQNEIIQEQITKTLLERVISRPHSWGVLMTFIELINNPVYKFWQKDFVLLCPEIHSLSEHILHKCIPPVTTKHGPRAGG